MKKKFYLVAVMILAALVIVSCSPENLQDGKTPATKKAMTSSEYSENSRAIKSVSVVEAYTIANSENAASTTKSTSEGEYRLPFDGSEKISSSDIITQLKDKASKAESKEEKAFYEKIASALPKDYTVKVKAGSYVEFKKDANNLDIVSSLDITIVIDRKTIEIEKDADDKWIEIDGTFFDNTQLEKMLDAAEDAAEAIEEIFKNLKNIKIDLNTLLNGGEQQFSIDIKDGEVLEARIEGTTVFKITDDKKLSTSFDFKYTEFEDDGKTIDEEFNLNASLLLNIYPASIGDINLKLIENAKVTINGMEVWADAFLDELD